MKKIYTHAGLGFVLLLNSCTTTLVSAKKQNTVDSVVKPNNTYAFITKDGAKEKILVANIDQEKIMGTNAMGKTISIDKTQISEVKKSNTLGTVIIAAGIVAAAVVLPAYIQNKPVGQ